MMKEAMIKLQEELAEKFPKQNFTEMIYDKQADINHTAHYYTFSMTNGKVVKEFQLNCLFIPYNETTYQFRVKQTIDSKTQKKTIKVTRWDIENGLFEQLKLHYNMK